MSVSITLVPIWVSILFVVLFSTIPVFLIANTVKKVLRRHHKETSLKMAKNIKVFYWVYFILISGVSLTGFFTKNVLPPRIILYSVIPLFLFYIFYIQKTNWFQLVLKDITLEQLVFIHVFRFVGSFFFLLYAYDVLPKSFAYIGGVGDILSALLVFPVIYALKNRKRYAKVFVWVWNFIGLADILSVLTTAIIITRISIENNDLGVAEFGTFPFSWIPAFAPATIVFLHVLVFNKLIEKKV